MGEKQDVLAWKLGHAPDHLRIDLSRVATPAGEAKYHKPIGTILGNITVVEDGVDEAQHESNMAQARHSRVPVFRHLLGKKHVFDKPSGLSAKPSYALAQAYVATAQDQQPRTVYSSLHGFQHAVDPAGKRAGWSGTATHHVTSEGHVYSLQRDNYGGMLAKRVPDDYVKEMLDFYAKPVVPHHHARLAPAVA